MTAAYNTDAPEPASSREDTRDALDELLAAAVVYEHGENPPVPEPVFVPVAGMSAAVKPLAVPTAPESRVSVLYWLAAVAWSLPGGIGGWLILRTTHPKTARSVLLVGVISFVMLVAIAIVFVPAYLERNPSHITIELPVSQ